MAALALPQAGTAPHREGALSQSSSREKRALDGGDIQLLGVPSPVSPHRGILWGLTTGSPVVTAIIQCSHNGEGDG